MQLISVIEGSELYQDILSEGINFENHSRVNNVDTMHHLEWVGSKFIDGTYNNIEVNSAHHQSIKNVYCDDFRQMLLRIDSQQIHFYLKMFF